MPEALATCSPPTLLHPVLASLSRTLARGDAQEDPEAAAALLESFRPQTPIQAMLAAQAIALHHAAMDCFGRAMEIDPEDHATATRLHRNAASLTRAFTAALRTLQRCQAEAAKEEAMQRGTGWDIGEKGEEEKSSPSPCGRGLRGGGATPPSVQSPAEDPIQRENPTPRAWEDLTEAEQFAILYPERTAAGATSHEDADLWLPKFTSQPQGLPAAR